MLVCSHVCMNLSLRHCSEVAWYLQVWRTLLGLEERLLFVLDGYDEAVRGYPGVPGGREALGDAVDLLEGRMLKEARVILTCGEGWAHEVAGFMQRRVLLSGLQWPQVRVL